MFVPFESLSPSSRLWIYQSDRKFTEQEKTIIAGHLQLFTERWAAHGQTLKASFDIRYDQFILIAADEGYQATSGCSIDDAVRTIQEAGRRINADLFNRSLIAFKKDGGVVIIPQTELKQKFAEAYWNESTPTFNNLINTKGLLESEWIVPSAQTWLKRYVPSEKVAP